MKAKGPFFPAKHAGKCPLNYIDGKYETHAIIVGDLIVRLERPVQWTEERRNQLARSKAYMQFCSAEYVHLECLKRYQEREQSNA